MMATLNSSVIDQQNGPIWSDESTGISDHYGGWDHHDRALARL